MRKGKQLGSTEQIGNVFSIYFKKLHTVMSGCMYNTGILSRGLENN